MIKRTFPKTGWDVGVIGFGAWGIGGQWGPVERQTAIDTMHAAIDAGMNFLDTADAYGDPPGTSERLMAELLKDRRDQVYVATKVGNLARRSGHPLPCTHWLHVDLCCDASLRRMKIDTIDLYQCHLGGCTEPDVFLEAFDRLIDAGKIRAFGISTDRVEVLQAFNRDGKCASNQLDYSFLNRSAEQELLHYCQQAEIATIIRGPLHKGVATGKFNRQTTFTDSVRDRNWNQGDGREQFLHKLDVVDRVRDATGRTQGALADLALGYVISHPAVTVAIPGAKNPEQAKANAAAGQAVLDDATLDAIRRVTA